MAQTTRKTTTNSKKLPPKKGNDQGSNVITRILFALLCLCLSLFSFIGFFKVDAWFITTFCGLVKGFIGGGYWIFPFGLLVCSGVLLLHPHQKVSFRVISIFVSILLFGALFHLFAGKELLSFGKGILGNLYKSGMSLKGGGLFGGLIAILLKSALSIYGAIPIILATLVLFTLTSVGYTIPRILSSGQKKAIDYKEKVERQVAENAQFARENPEEYAAMKEAKRQKRRKSFNDVLNDESFTEESLSKKPSKKQAYNNLPMEKAPSSAPIIKEEDMPSISNLPTDNVAPLSVNEAAEIAGVPAAHLSQITTDEKKPTAASTVSKKISREDVEAETEEIAKTIEKSMEEPSDAYRFPPVSLLKTGFRKHDFGQEEMHKNRERLESTIKSFGVNASICGITRGPTVTRYDLALDQGVKLAKITNLAGDIALSLGVSSVRIAPIPDKISTVGIEVPNKTVSTVFLHDIIGSSAFKMSKSKLSFAIGEDIAGSAIVGNIAKLPHLLIAGTTGSGKSVCMNSLILSILYKSSPEEVRLIMIDPKMVELGIYNGIPHLFVPVVTDPKKAAGALQWAVVEMLKRYRLFSEVGVRDLEGYNNHRKMVGEQTMPRVVIVIDELADLMLVASKEVEESICRVAQMGRASGMHLVIATQRPSADVITGLMKANIPSRIAFAVSSAMESRIILDNSGAEKLIGQGDMLYAPLGVGKPMRVQGAFVSDEEREDIINYIKDGTETNYSSDILEQIEKAAVDKQAASQTKSRELSSFGEDYDELLDQAVEVILETKQASTSLLQRRLKLGYARAARIVDQMEEIGIVGPSEGSKPRQILISKEKWDIRQGKSQEACEEQVSFAKYEDAPHEEWSE